MGDKTQLAAMTNGGAVEKTLAVFIAAALALTAVSAIGVLAGSVLGQLPSTPVDQAHCRSRIHRHWNIEFSPASSEKGKADLFGRLCGTFRPFA